MKSIRFALLTLLCLWVGSVYAQIAIYGDTRSNETTHRQVVQAIAAHKPKIAFHTGDLNTKGIAQSEYDIFFQISQPLTDLCPIYPAKGNHERSEPLFLSNFPALNGKTYYTVMHEGLRFIVLDSTRELAPNSEQYKWLSSVLADSMASIVMLHHPIFSSGAHGDELGLSLYLPGLLSGSGVKAVFSGHDHNYERSEYNGISYIVSGGGGAPMRESKTANPHSLIFLLENHYIIASKLNDTMDFTVYSINGDILDSFIITGI
jgi:3',5'-cyclic AMP phosphodiesterase CpdA